MVRVMGRLQRQFAISLSTRRGAKSSPGGAKPPLWLKAAILSERSIPSQLALAVLPVGVTMAVYSAFLSGREHGWLSIFFPALTLAALFGGLPAGTLAALLSILFVSFWIIPFGAAPNWSEALPFLFLSMAIILMAEALHWMHKQALVAAQENTRFQQAVKALEEREAWLKAILDGTADGIITIDERGHIETINPAAIEIFGYAPEEVIGNSVNMLMPEYCREAHSRYVAHSAKTTEPRDARRLRQVEGRRKDGSVFPMDCGVSDVFFGNKHLFVGVVRDVTERKIAEEQIKLLMHEVNHRSKNVLAVVQAVSRQMAAGEDEKAFAGRLSERLAALAASHDLLVESEWRGVKLGELVCSQLAHFRDLIGPRITLKGPPVFVTASASQAIGMALHELATNAGKYGALSNSDGRIQVEWELPRAEPGLETFVISWRESGGPAVIEPEKQGFGSTVIRKLAEISLGAKVDLSFAPAGLCWRLACEATEILDRNTPGIKQAARDVSGTQPAKQPPHLYGGRRVAGSA